MTNAQGSEELNDEKLKATLWYSIGQAVDSVSLNQDLNATPHFIGGLSEMVWSQIDNVARDLEAFAKHAGRSTINSQDVLLLARRNEGLVDIMQSEVKTTREKGKNSR